MKHIPLAIIFAFLIGALAFAIIDNWQLRSAIITLQGELLLKNRELEVYHINDAEIRAHDRETWGIDTIETPPQLFDSLKWYRIVFVNSDTGKVIQAKFKIIWADSAYFDSTFAQEDTGR